jgi:hypothetical protein
MTCAATKANKTVMETRGTLFTGASAIGHGCYLHYGEVAILWRTSTRPGALSVLIESAGSP